MHWKIPPSFWIYVYFCLVICNVCKHFVSYSLDLKAKWTYFCVTLYNDNIRNGVKLIQICIWSWSACLSRVDICNKCMVPGSTWVKCQTLRWLERNILKYGYLYGFGSMLNKLISMIYTIYSLQRVLRFLFYHGQNFKMKILVLFLQTWIFHSVVIDVV